MTHESKQDQRSPVERNSTNAVTRPITRRALREQQRAAEAIAQISAVARTLDRAVVTQGSPLIYTSRRAMREAATRKARDLPVTLAAPAMTAPFITVDAPALGIGSDHAPRSRATSAATTRIVRPRRTDDSAARRRFRRSVARQVTAAASLLFIGSLVVVTSLPAQAMQPQPELDPLVAEIEPPTQSLDPVSVEATVLFSRDDVVVNDPAETARMSVQEMASLQALANSEPRGNSYGGDPSLPRTWGALQTDYIQTPFPDVAHLPISSGFGFRPGGFHGGTDIPLPQGREIRPIANGVVSEVWQGNNPGGGGYVVFVDHNINGQFVQSWYAHMRSGSIRVEVGQVVDITSVLGEVGSSGRSTGPHLHLELKNSDYVSFDPVLWLQTRQLRLENGY